MKILYRTGFTQIPNHILRSRVLKPMQKVVLTVLCSYANDDNVAYPSYQTIADDSGISRRKVIAIISELVELGCIRKIERKSTKGDNTANDYEVLIGSADFALPSECDSLPSAQDSLPGGEYPAPRGAQRAPNKYPDNNINNYNNIHRSITQSEMDEMEEMIKSNINYDFLKEKNRDDRLDELVSLIVETVCGNSPTVRIGGNDFPRVVVKSQFLKIDGEHIEYVLDCIQENTTKIKNIKAYMLTCLYNSLSTISNYYTAEVNHDLYGSS